MIDTQNKNTLIPRKFQALAVNRVLNGVSTYRFLSRGHWVPLALRYHCAKPEKGVADTYQIVGTDECISPEDVRFLLADGSLIPTTTPQHVSLLALLDEVLNKAA